ncbi:MAG: beta-ketoacyl-ACP synthase II [Anaerolineae bacterium]|nr:beta-ketoacyl-ACP synthase II [Anaerolineae bacterium]
MAIRVVVTGMGAVSPLGNDLPTSWSAAVAGKSGITRITRFDPDGYRSQIAGEVKNLDPNQHFDRRDARRMDPVLWYALIAGREAVADAGLSTPMADSDRVGVIVASGIGGLTTTSKQVEVLLKRGPDRVSPFLVPMILPDAAASRIAIEFGLRGPNMAVTSACASGTNAIGEAYAMIRRGIADAMLCGGSEAGIVPIALAGFSAMRALSERNDDPLAASRPFDKDRDGFVIAEGAAILVLEALDHARARGARIYGELVGYGSTDDAYHIAAPLDNGAEAARCMRLALAEAGLTPEDVDYINAHGTSTPLNDVTETHAIRAALGDAADDVAVSSTKSVTGHLLGAAGALEAAFTLKALQEGVLPPTMNLDEPDPECDLDYVPNVAREADVKVALSNSFGFGGHNACLAFRRWEV